MWSRDVWLGTLELCPVGQLVACGLTSAAIVRRVRAGRLHPVHRGVYAAGFVLDARRIIPDLLWRAQRLIVEADSKAYHSGPLALSDDAERQAILKAHGPRVLRVTWRQAIAHPGQTIARVSAALDS